MINELKFGYNGALTRGFGRAPVVNGVDTSAISINVTGAASNSGIPGQGSTTGIAVAGGLVRLNSQANGRGSPYTPWTLSFIDNLSWITGKHSVKFGGEVRPVRFYTDRMEDAVHVQQLVGSSGKPACQLQVRWRSFQPKRVQQRRHRAA